MPTTEAKGGIPLATPRLTLRPVADEDLAEIVALAGDADVAEWTVSIRHPLSTGQVKAWLDALRAKGEHAFAILPKGEETLIGCVGVNLGEGKAKPEIGYWIGRAYWGQGYATEAVRRVLLYAFGALGLAEVEATVFPGNARSIRVLEKTGFSEQRKGSRAAPARGGDREVIVYALRRAEFARVTLSQAVGRE